MPTSPSKRGGARPGAGRPSNAAKGLETIEKMTLGLTKAQMAEVRGIAVVRSVSPSEAVREMVATYLDSLDKKRGRQVRAKMK